MRRSRTATTGVPARHPLRAKDIVDVEGIRGPGMRPPFRDRIASTTATVIERLDARHAVMLGKTSVG